MICKSRKEPTMSRRIAYISATTVACLLAGTALAQTTPTVDAPGQGAQAQPGSSGEADVEAIVNAQFAVSGNHKGVRASGAKGVCVKGAFTPSPEAPSLSKAPHFARVTPMTARFSMGDRKSTRLNSSHANISYAVFCLKKD